MNQLAIGTVLGRTQPAIEFPTENRKNNSREYVPQSSKKQIKSNKNWDQKSRKNDRVQDNSNCLKQSTYSHNASVNENSIQLNCYNNKTYDQKARIFQFGYRGIKWIRFEEDLSRILVDTGTIYSYVDKELLAKILNTNYSIFEPISWSLIVAYGETVEIIGWNI